MENWKDILGYEGAYQVSDFGNVRSLDRFVNSPHGALRRHRGRTLAPNINGRRYNYLSVQLSVDLKKVRRLIHLLVLETFVGPKPSGMEGCHGDGHVSNNTLKNLRWDTPKANSADKVIHGTLLCGEQSPSAKLSVSQVLQIRERAKVEIHRKIAKDFGMSRQQVDKIVNRTRWAHIP